MFKFIFCVFCKSAVLFFQLLDFLFSCLVRGFLFLYSISHVPANFFLSSCLLSSLFAHTISTLLFFSFITKGYMEMITSLNRDLAEITGFAAVSAQPNSGAQV